MSMGYNPLHDIPFEAAASYLEHMINTTRPTLRAHTSKNGAVGRKSASHPAVWPTTITPRPSDHRVETTLWVSISHLELDFGKLLTAKE